MQLAGKLSHHLNASTLERRCDCVGAASLGLMLGVNSTLEELDLYGNPLGPDGVEVLLVPSYW